MVTICCHGQQYMGNGVTSDDSDVTIRFPCCNSAVTAHTFAIVGVLPTDGPLYQASLSGLLVSGPSAVKRIARLGTTAQRPSLCQIRLSRGGQTLTPASRSSLGNPTSNSYFGSPCRWRPCPDCRGSPSGSRGHSGEAQHGSAIGWYRCRLVD